MSAIARYYKFKGYPVAGYDKTPSDLTHALEKEGIDVHYTDDVDYIPKDVASTLVVYTPAIPEDLKELMYVREHGYTVVKRSRMLGELAEGQTCLAVAGTHGKTTTSTLVAHILTESKDGCSAFLGGISNNYGTNLLMSHSQTIVAEADEFDRSFLQLRPAIAAITAMDADHLDIYGTHEEYCKAFKKFASQVSRYLIVKHGLDITPEDTNARIFTYSYDDPQADFHARDPHPDELGHYIFDLVHPDGVIEGIRVGIPGWVNVENSVAAAAICLKYKVSPLAIKEAIGSYKGVKRRLEAHVNSSGTPLGNLVAQGDVPGKEDNGRVPAAPVHPHQGFRRWIRRGPQRGGQADPAGHIPGKGRTYTGGDFGDHLLEGDRPGKGTVEERRVDGLPRGRTGRHTRHIRRGQHRQVCGTYS